MHRAPSPEPCSGACGFLCERCSEQRPKCALHRGAICHLCDHPGEGTLRSYVLVASGSLAHPSFPLPWQGAQHPPRCDLRATVSLSPRLSPCPHPGRCMVPPSPHSPHLHRHSLSHTYVHSHTSRHTLTHTHEPTYSQSLPHGHTHHITTLICSYTHSDSLPYTHTLTRTHTLSHVHVYSHSPTLTHCLTHTPCFREDQAAGHSHVPTLSSASRPPSPEVCSHHMGTCQPPLSITRQCVALPRGWLVLVFRLLRGCCYLIT